MPNTNFKKCYID
ncbi:uncharacterized protein FPRN_15247 [Fusarium proliferatum]|nr:uncharacterized protein FPRN_15247 [Fusarium proliferatum]